MKVFIYHCPDAPEHHRYVGRMLVAGAGAQGGAGFLPVIASGATAEIAEQKLRDVWRKDGETKLRKRGQLQPADAPSPRYFYHPESDSLMVTNDGTHPGTDGLVEEIDRAAYDRIKAEQEAAAVVPDDEDDDLGGLLG